MNVINLIGKQVYSIYEGEIVGTVLNVFFNKDYTKITGIKIFDENEDEFYIQTASIKSFNDCVLITNKNKLNQTFSNSFHSPLSLEVIGENAKKYGLVKDVEIDETGKVLFFITSKQSRLAPPCIYIRKDFILYSENKILISNYRPKNKNLELSKIKVNILNIAEEKTHPNFVPSKIQYNTDTILGKIAKSDLYGLNNEIIIKANQTITDKIIIDAERHNRLNQLYFIAN